MEWAFWALAQILIEDNPPLNNIAAQRLHSDLSLKMSVHESILAHISSRHPFER